MRAAMVAAPLLPHVEELRRIKVQVGCVRKRLKRERLITRVPSPSPEAETEQEYQQQETCDFLFGPGSRCVLATLILSDFDGVLASKHMCLLNHVDINKAGQLADVVEKAYIAAP